MKTPKPGPAHTRTDRFARALAADEVVRDSLEPLSTDEVAAERATDLPDREAMSIIAAGDNVAAPVNEATAINYSSDSSIAVADADQIVSIEQTDVDPAAPEVPIEDGAA